MDDLERRKELVDINSCDMKKCDYLKDRICTHPEDTVSKKDGRNCCPLLWHAVKRENFKG